MRVVETVGEQGFDDITLRGRIQVSAHNHTIWPDELASGRSASIACRICLYPTLRSDGRRRIPFQMSIGDLQARATVIE